MNAARHNRKRGGEVPEQTSRSVPSIPLRHSHFPSYFPLILPVASRSSASSRQLSAARPHIDWQASLCCPTLLKASITQWLSDAVSVCSTTALDNQPTPQPCRASHARVSRRRGRSQQLHTRRWTSVALSCPQLAADVLAVRCAAADRTGARSIHTASTRGQRCWRTAAPTSSNVTRSS